MMHYAELAIAADSPFSAHHYVFCFCKVRRYSFTGNT